MSNNNQVQEFNFWPVYSDLAMVIVLVLLLLSMGLVVVVMQLYGLVSRSVVDAQQQVKTAIENNPDTKGIVTVCEPQGNNQLIVLSADAVFPPNEAAIGQMRARGRELVKAIGEVLAGQEHSYQRIQIEGHASYEVPNIRKERKKPGETEEAFEQRYADLNWDLSAARAGAVMHMFIETRVPPDKMSAAALGHYRPLSVDDPCQSGTRELSLGQANETAAQREHNRRINILVMYGAK